MAEETDTVETESEDTGAADQPAETEDTTETASAGTEKVDDGKDWEKEAARLRSELAKARKWEKQAKSNADAAKRLSEMEEAQKTAEQKAQDSARRAEERAQAANQRVARAEVKAALTGVVDDPESIIEDLNLSRYLTDDGEPDEDAIETLRTKYEALRPPTRRAPNPNPAQGANGSKEHEKPYTHADLKSMTNEEINAARREGKLDHLMGRRTAHNK